MKVLKKQFFVCKLANFFQKVNFAERQLLVFLFSSALGKF